MSTPTPNQLTPPRGWSNPGRVRMPPLTTNESGFATRWFVKLINKFGGLEASNLFLMLIRNPRLFLAWLFFASRMMPNGTIDRRDTELIILRVGWNCRARYEWGQHVDIGLRAGLTPEDIARVPLGANAPGWEPRIVTLMQACDEFHHDRMIAEPTWLELEQYYDAQHLLEVIMLIGHYEMLAGVLNSTGLPLDPRLEDVLATLRVNQNK